jgi:hypothetical protein
MTDRDTPQAGEDAALDAECEVFTRHLIGCDPDSYVKAKYRAAHAAVRQLEPAPGFDRRLLAFARPSPVRAKLADAYAGLFLPASSLRKRLVLLLAILETRPPFHHTIDRAPGGTKGALVWQLAATGVSAVAFALTGAVVLMPLHLASALRGKAAE